MSVSITGVDAVLKQIEEQINQLVNEVGTSVQQSAKANTPVKTGNARRHWSRDSTKMAFDVTNTVPYIEKLEKGSSRQAPNGIIMPTLNQVKGKYK